MKLVYVAGPGRKTVHMLDETTRFTFCNRDIWHIRDFNVAEDMQKRGYLVPCKSCQRKFPSEFKVVTEYIEAHPRSLV